MGKGNVESCHPSWTPREEEKKSDCPGEGLSVSWGSREPGSSVLPLLASGDADSDSQASLPAWAPGRLADPQGVSKG